MSTTLTFTQADYLRKAREVAHLSQRELAARMGMSRETIINVERRGTRKAYVIREWARATGVDESQLQAQPSDYMGQVPRRPTLSRPRNHAAITRPRGRP